MKLNDSKTDCLIICSPRMRSNIRTETVPVGDSLISPSSSARNLGVLFDRDMDLQAHVRKVCQISYMHLRNISAIRGALTDKAAESLIHAFVTSRLDCCNSLLAGLPQKTLHKLQVVQNSAARLLARVRKRDHITPTLRRLHWLPVTFRIRYKLILLVYKALHGSAPHYLQELLQLRNTRPGLRSSAMLLTVPRTRLVGYGDRAFSCMAPSLWNALPDSVRVADTLASFKSKLKTHLFQAAYSS